MGYAEDNWWMVDACAVRLTVMMPWPGWRVVLGPVAGAEGGIEPMLTLIQEQKRINSKIYVKSRSVNEFG